MKLNDDQFRFRFQLQQSANHIERRSRGSQCLLHLIGRRFVQHPSTDNEIANILN